MGCNASTPAKVAPPEQLGTANAALLAAVAFAATAEPLPPAGQFAETWDGGATFHWSGEKDKANVKIDGASARVAAERRAMEAVMALDKAQLALYNKQLAIASHRSVSVAWLLPPFTLTS